MKFQQLKQHIPNTITLLRLILVLIAFVFLILHWYVAAFAVGIISAVSDYLDGYLARKWHVQSAFGERYDPLIDKVGVLLSLGFFTIVYQISIVYFLVIVARELIITVIREQRYLTGKKMPADMFGKIKTNLQFGLIVLFFLQVMGVVNLDILWLEVAYFVVTAWTAWSGLNYLHKLSSESV